MTLVPLKVYLRDGYAKLLLGLAKGKHDYDKRESIKRREQNRDIAYGSRKAITNTSQAQEGISGNLFQKCLLSERGLFFPN